MKVLLKNNAFINNGLNFVKQFVFKLLDVTIIIIIIFVSVYFIKIS